MGLGARTHAESALLKKRPIWSGNVFGGQWGSTTFLYVATATSPTVRDVMTFLAAGLRTYRAVFLPGTAMAVAVLGVFGVARATAAAMASEGDLVVALLVDLLGLLAATVVALPWFRVVLAAARHRPTSMAEAIQPHGLGAMFGAAFFFWAGVLLGVRYLLGIPSIFVLLWYGLFGYAVADGETSGMRALGTSVRLGQGRRAIVGAVALVLMLFNLVGALAIGVQQTPVTIAITLVLLAVTTNISMGVGAELYLRLLESVDVPGEGTA